MPAHNTYIRRYQYEFYGDQVKQKNQPLAMLYLYSDNNTLIAAIAFGAEADARPPVENEGIVIASYPAEVMSSMIDMLRNEKPVIFSWDATAQTTRITTGNEPVGEQELRKLFSFLYI